MLQHLISLNIEPLAEAASSFVGVEKASPAAIVESKTKTEEWLDSLGANAPVQQDPALEKVLAAHAFAAATTPATQLGDAQKSVMKANALALVTRGAVQETARMLSEYQWNFVEQATNIRSYVVTKLVDVVENEKKADARLKALKLLGEVTEVALFTQRTEVVTKDLSDEELERQINERLEKLTFSVPAEVVDVVDISDATYPKPPAPPRPPPSSVPDHPQFPTDD